MGGPEVVTPCKLHSYTPDKDGYAKMSINYKKVYLHRYVYCRHHGIDLSSIEGMVVRHKCDNPRCVNPDHLELGTNKDNVDDRVSRGRSHKPIGVMHPGCKLTEEQVLAIREEYNIPGTRYKHLAEKYGVSEKQIGNIINRKLWGHLK